MAEEIKKNAPKVVVCHDPKALPAKRITEDQFSSSPSEWLLQAKSGQQIIVVDKPDSAKVVMVLGVNGVAFKIQDEKSAAPSEGAW